MFIVSVPLRGQQAPSGAAFFLIAEGRSVRPSSIETCRSSGAWLDFGAVLARNMALLPELEAPSVVWQFQLHFLGYLNPLCRSCSM